MKIDTIKLDGKKGSKVEVLDSVFSADYNETLVHQVLVAEMAASRAGTKAQKNRSAVRGGGAKPWRQKGTGRARAGTSRSPIWKGGGVTFSASNRNFEQKVNRKMFQGALRSVLSELNRTKRLIVIESLSLESPKTKLMATLLKTLKVDESQALLVTENWDDNLYLASRNLHKVGLVEVDWVAPITLIGQDKIIITLASLKSLEERLA